MGHIIARICGGIAVFLLVFLVSAAWVGGIDGPDDVKLFACFLFGALAECIYLAIILW